jgi:hypothetical protein
MPFYQTEDTLDVPYRSGSVARAQALERTDEEYPARILRVSCRQHLIDRA